jgi:hypothetical protein
MMTSTTNHSNEIAFAALIEAQSHPHVAIIWRGEKVVFLEEHPDVKAATAALFVDGFENLSKDGDYVGLRLCADGR